MLFEGNELREIIARTSNQIDLRNEYGRTYGFTSAAEALAMDLEQFIGVGNRRRLRFLRARTARFILNAGSRTTYRLKGQSNQNIAHPLIQQHRRNKVAPTETKITATNRREALHETS